MDFGHHLWMSYFRENSMNQAVYTDILSKGLTTLLRFFKSLFPETQPGTNWSFLRIPHRTSSTS